MFTQSGTLNYPSVELPVLPGLVHTRYRLYCSTCYQFQVTCVYSTPVYSESIHSFQDRLLSSGRALCCNDRAIIFTAGSLQLQTTGYNRQWQFLQFVVYGPLYKARQLSSAQQTVRSRTRVSDHQQQYLKDLQTQCICVTHSKG